MPQSDKPKTQKTQPKKGKPVEIPVPKRSEFQAALKKVANPQKGSKKTR